MCSKTLALSTASQSALTNMQMVKKHLEIKKLKKELKKKRQNFFSPWKKSTDSIISSSSAKERKQQMLDVHL